MQNQNIQTATWKTYTNTAYGFEVKYPLGVQISSTGPNDAQQSLSQGEQISGTVSPSYDIIVFSQNNNEIGEIGVFNISNTLTSNVVKTGKPFSQEDYIKNYLYLQGPCDVRWDFKENSINQINLNNITALEVKGTSGLDNFSCYYIANNPGLLLVMSTKNNLGIFDTIISTFKFTK